ncbi:hypothetical protein ACHQM5_009801 [Ranunculus cassubicifolius]
MAQQQDGGWPLGLQPVNVRVGLAGNQAPDFSGSISFNTLLTASPSSCSDSSSELDTESTGSFFHDKSITLGSLIGVSSILELSGRSFRGRGGPESTREKKNYRTKTWPFSLCSRNSVDTKNVITPSSLGHFLAVERRASSGNGYEAEDLFVDAHPVTEPNSLFVDGRVAPPHSSPWLDSDIGSLDHRDDGRVLFPCICGHPSC